MIKNRVFIGDNYSVMNSVCMEEYIGKVKMIYIDPPYNTGSEFSYRDRKGSSSWLRDISDRLRLSMKFLAEDGLIFISIDDNEYAYLKVEVDKIFGKKNFVGTFITNQAKRSNSRLINTVHEYILCYAKNKKKCNGLRVRRVDIPEDKRLIDKIISIVKGDFRMFGREVALRTLRGLIKAECEARKITWLKNYNNIDEEGNIFFAMDLSTPGKPRSVDIPSIGLHLEPLPSRGWASDKKFIELHEKGLLSYKGERPYEIHYLSDATDNVSSILPYYSRQGKHNLVRLGLRDIFDTPKPVELIKFLIRITCCDRGLILDYYAGSGTTAQAVYEVNEEDNKQNSYILIQANEAVKSDSVVYGACSRYGIKPSIPDILRLRIDTYLKLNGKEKDYQIQEIEGEGIFLT